MEHKRKDPRAVLNKGGGGVHPACFPDAEGFRQWYLLLVLSGEHRRSGYCLDCTPEYKTQMMAEGRCEHPETKWVMFKNRHEADQLDVVGVSSESIYWAKVENGATVVGRQMYGQDQQQG